jgi:hypothetical protein
MHVYACDLTLTHFQQKSPTTMILVWIQVICHFETDLRYIQNFQLKTGNYYLMIPFAHVSLSMTSLTLLIIQLCWQYLNKQKIYKTRCTKFCLRHKCNSFNWRTHRQKWKCFHISFVFIFSTLHIVLLTFK